MKEKEVVNTKILEVVLTEGEGDLLYHIIADQLDKAIKEDRNNIVELSGKILE